MVSFNKTCRPVSTCCLLHVMQREVYVYKLLSLLPERSIFAQSPEGKLQPLLSLSHPCDSFLEASKASLLFTSWQPSSLLLRCMHICLCKMHVCICTYVCVHVRVYAHISACICMHLCTYIWMYACAHTHTCMCMRVMCLHVYVCLHTCICMYVCMHVCVYMLRKRTARQSLHPLGDSIRITRIVLLGCWKYYYSFKESTFHPIFTWLLFCLFLFFIVFAYLTFNDCFNCLRGYWSI